MRSLWVSALCFVAALMAAPRADAQASAIPADDPASFAQTISQQVARDRTEPLRRTMSEMLGGASMPPDVDAAFIAMERYLNGVQANQIVMLDDVQMAGTLRTIYYVHTFDDRFMFTRFDFMRYPAGWKLMSLKFAGTWDGIAAATSPGWTPTPR